MNKMARTKLIADIVDKLNEQKLSSEELIDVYAHLGINIGCSIAEIKEVPDMKVLEEHYYTNPNAGEALILQSMTLMVWTGSQGKDNA